MFIRLHGAINFYYHSLRLLPTHDSEYESSKHDRRYEYGFYEPPLDKMQKGRIMFKEAMEVSSFFCSFYS